MSVAAECKLSQALSVLAGAEYLALNATVSRLCRDVRVAPLPRGGCPLSTWRPRGSFFFTLLKTAGGTVLYCHENARAYHAAPCAWLSAQCPADTGFLCQWCVDGRKGGPGEPHLLVFDLLLPECPDVAERGRRLRGMAMYLPLPLCVLQWVGDGGALDAFVPSLPHEVECILGLGPDPWQLYRQLRIDVPATGWKPDSIRQLGVVAK